MDTVKFKCNRSGNVIAFNLENDIIAMRKEEGYTELVVVPIEQPLVETPSPEKKKAGRPRKGS